MTTAETSLLTLFARWVGIALVGLVVALWLSSFVFLGWGCDHDCGDQGGRGTFLALTLFTPLAALGVALIVGSLRRALRSGRWPARGWRRTIAAIRLVVFLGLVVGALLAVLLAAVAVEGFVSPDKVNDQPDYTTPVIFGLFAVFWGVTVWLGRRVLTGLGRLLAHWPKRPGHAGPSAAPRTGR